MQATGSTAETRAVVCPICDAPESEAFAEVRGWRIARCRDCRFLFVNPRPTEAALLALYAGRGENPFTDPKFESFEDELPGLRSIVRRLRRWLPAGRLLELGCGRGDLLRVAHEAGYEAEGCDLYGGNVPECRGVSLHDGFLRDVAFPAGSFDAVVTRNTLEHLESPRVELREIHRVLRAGGLLYVKVPNEAFEHGWRCRLAFGPAQMFDPPWHLNHFRPASLARLLHSTGFDVLSWQTEIPTRSPVRRTQLLRQAGYWAFESLRLATGGTFFPKPVLVCIARRR